MIQCQIYFLRGWRHLLAEDEKRYNTSVKILSFLIATVDNKCLYPNDKLLSQYFCYLNVCNTEIFMCGWKDCVALSGPAAAWMPSWMSLTPVSHRECQRSLSSACFVSAHISEWQHSHRKCDDGRSSVSSTWAAAKHASHDPLTLVMWYSLNRHC